MTSLAQRLFHLFEPSDIERANQEIRPIQVSSPRVGQVKAVVTDEQGISHDVLLELSATRRGGMTLETRSTSRRGKAGLPCAELAAVLLEVDRRGFFSGVHEHTPIELDVLADEDAEEDELLDLPADEVDNAATDESGSSGNAGDASDEADDEPRVAAPVVQPTRQTWPSGRQPAWSVDLEARRRLVEPAVRTLLRGSATLGKTVVASFFCSTSTPPPRHEACYSLRLGSRSMSRETPLDARSPW